MISELRRTTERIVVGRDEETGHTDVGEMLHPQLAGRTGRMERIAQQHQACDLETSSHCHAADPSAHGTSTDHHSRSLDPHLAREVRKIGHQFGDEGIGPRRPPASSSTTVRKVMAEHGKWSQMSLEGAQGSVIGRSSCPRS